MFAPISKAIAGAISTAIIMSLAFINVTPGMTVEEAVGVVVGVVINFLAIYLAPKNQ